MDAVPGMKKEEIVLIHIYLDARHATIEIQQCLGAVLFCN